MPLWGQRKESGRTKEGGSPSGAQAGTGYGINGVGVGQTSAALYTAAARPGSSGAPVPPSAPKSAGQTRRVSNSAGTSISYSPGTASAYHAPVVYYGGRAASPSAGARRSPSPSSRGRPPSPGSMVRPSTTGAVTRQPPAPPAHIQQLQSIARPPTTTGTRPYTSFAQSRHSAGQMEGLSPTSPSGAKAAPFRVQRYGSGSNPQHPASFPAGQWMRPGTAAAAAASGFADATSMQISGAVVSSTSVASSDSASSVPGARPRVERPPSGNGASGSYPTGLPPPSPTKPAPLRIMQRANSARQPDSPLSLLAMIESQQGGYGSGGEPGTPGARAAAAAPAAAAAAASGRPPSSGGGTGSASAAQQAAMARSTLALQQQNLGQRRFSTGSVAAQQFYEAVAGAAAGQEGAGAPAAAHGSTGGAHAVPPSPHGNPSWGGSSAKLAEGYGTLTCLRPSTYASNFALNFAAESQGEVDMHASGQHVGAPALPQHAQGTGPLHHAAHGASGALQVHGSMGEELMSPGLAPGGPLSPSKQSMGYSGSLAAAYRALHDSAAGASAGAGTCAASRRASLEQPIPEQGSRLRRSSIDDGSGYVPGAATSIANQVRRSSIELRTRRSLEYATVPPAGAGSADVPPFVAAAATPLSPTPGVHDAMPGTPVAAAVQAGSVPARPGSPQTPQQQPASAAAAVLRPAPATPSTPGYHPAAGMAAAHSPHTPVPPTAPQPPQQAAAAAPAAPKPSAPAPASAQGQQVVAAAIAAGIPEAIAGMFACVASAPVQIMPPVLPKVTDYAAALGGELNSEHSAVLPGYAVGKVIGEGGFCQVRLAIHQLSGRKVAVKIIDKAKLADANEAKRIQREIRVMRHLTHECVIKLFEVVDTPKMLYLIMEHAPNGSLLDYVRARKRLAEQDAAYILQQIVAGLEYCHRREVVHRDVKLENILLDADNGMKVIDFGLSAFFVPGKRLRVHCGSPSYAAPEIVARKQYDGPPVDVWSLGVVLFAMLAGYLPFHSSSGNKQELCAKIMEGRYTPPESLSALAKDLLSRMLTVDPDRRITLDAIMGHPWVKAAAKWEPVGGSIYMVRADPTTGAVYADDQLVSELEAAGYNRQIVLQHLLNQDTNYITAGYYLLAEGKAEVIRRMRGPAAVRRYTSRSAPGAQPGDQQQPPSGVAAGGAAGGGSTAAAATNTRTVGATAPNGTWTAAGGVSSMGAGQHGGSGGLGWSRPGTSQGSGTGMGGGGRTADSASSFGAAGAGSGGTGKPVVSVS